MSATPPPTPDGAARVSTLELFFDLVFVFTITQLTTVLFADPTPRGLLRVALMLGVIWYCTAATRGSPTRSPPIARDAGCSCSVAWPLSWSSR